MTNVAFSPDGQTLATGKYDGTVLLLDALTGEPLGLPLTTKEGLYQHIRHICHIAERCELPIVLYNVPGRTGSDLLPSTIARLGQLPNVVGIKEASGSLDRASEIIRLTEPEFVVLSGDDSLTLPIMSVGGRGVISVVSQIVPQAPVALTTAVLCGDYDRARTIHLDLLELCNAMFVETNPVPVKTAGEMLGMTTSEIRLPLVSLLPESRERVFRALLACPYTANQVVMGEEMGWPTMSEPDPVEVAA